VAEKKSSTVNRFKPVKEVSVMAWIENQFGDVLLLKQSQGNKFWTLPGGKVRMRESLVGALKREVLEETSLKIQSIVLSHVYDRSPKGVLTFVFRARIKGRNDTVFPKLNEIETAKFSSTQLQPASPSLRFFWKKMHRTQGDSQLRLN